MKPRAVFFAPAAAGLGAAGLLFGKRTADAWLLVAAGWGLVNAAAAVRYALN